MQSNTRKNAFDALFYLIWTIVKQQWKTLLAMIIFILIIIPLPKLIAMQGGYQTTPNGIIGLFYTLPVLLITLVYLPMVHNQIYSSSIRKRLKSSGVSEKIYATTMILLFSAIALVAFYFLALVANLIWMNSTFQQETNPAGDLVNIDVWFQRSINWLSLLVLSPIAIIGMSSTGLLIGRMKISEIVKGVLIFLFIVVLILMSRTIINPIYSDMGIGESVPPDYDAVVNPAAIVMNKLFIANPWGSMLFTMQDSFDSYVHQLVAADSGGYESLPIISEKFKNGRNAALVWSSISSVGLCLTSIFTIK